MDPGERDARIHIEQPTGGLDSYGGKTPTFGPYADAWAKVSYGTGQELRQAAQERATVPATFRVPYSTKLAAITAAFRIQYRGVWDIVSVVERGHREVIEIAAVKPPKEE